MTREFTEHMSYRENAPAGARSPFERGVEKAVPSAECTGRGRADIIIGVCIRFLPKHTGTLGGRGLSVLWGIGLWLWNCQRAALVDFTDKSHNKY